MNKTSTPESPNIVNTRQARAHLKALLQADHTTTIGRTSYGHILEARALIVPLKLHRYDETHNRKARARAQRQFNATLQTLKLH